MPRDKREPPPDSVPSVGIRNFDRYADALTGDYFRALGIGKLDWQKALEEFQSGDSARARLLRDLRNSRIMIDEHMPAQASLDWIEQYARVNTRKTKAALAHFDSIKIGGDLKIADLRKIAGQSFLEYFFSPFNDRRGGPCRHCGQYWVKKNKRQIAYCSKVCGSKHTARISNRKRRRNDRVNLLETAQKSVTEWARSKQQIDWKKWVVSRHPEISKKFLSQLVKNVELVVPVKRKSVTRGG
jgi:hypothetical protein